VSASLPLIKASGTVLWRQGTPDPEIALVHRARYDDWSLPKGKAEPGEHGVVTAVRETYEETRARARLGRPLITVRYDVDGQPKRVRYWAARLIEQEPFEPGPEIAEVAWLPVEQARARLSYPHDIDVVDDFVSAPYDTQPFIVLRHAKAVKRSAWSGDEHSRPLSKRGAAQAERLVPLLSAYAPARLHTSDELRCQQTVAPYAAAASVKLEDEPLLSEEGWERHPRKGQRLVDELFAAAEPLLVCTHRPVLPGLLHRLLASSGLHMPGGPLSPGEFVVIHREPDDAKPHAVSVERHTP
jgi:8-oxo-dGTP pyrophosphatase MutT (NUDIX family)/phosphohistidine phosphatase SixA